MDYYMEFARFKTRIFVGIVEAYYPGWTCTVDTQVTGIIFVITFMSNFKSKKGRASYWILRNNPLPYNIQYNNQL